MSADDIAEGLKDLRVSKEMIIGEVTVNLDRLSRKAFPTILLTSPLPPIVRHLNA